MSLTLSGWLTGQTLRRAMGGVQQTIRQGLPFPGVVVRLIMQDDTEASSAISGDSGRFGFLLVGDGMFSNDSLSNGFALVTPEKSRQIPTEGVRVVGRCFLVPNVFELNRRLNVSCRN